ncbi:HPr(Ser) kinase/phosphatase [Mahella australiensis]|uniref:HPr(Ser) kinase/phosphatase n=1 Tax=Mahella australiensis TaxID=252966 RepID=UPI000316C3ED|nr:HPr(Ser) kinase/phosphatase [Mahella australiensis]
MNLLSVPIETLVEDLQLEVLYKDDCKYINISTSDVNRPGLQLAGFFDYFAYERIQVIGRVEMTYLMSIDVKTRNERLNDYFKYPIPCVIVSRGMDIPTELMDIAQTYKRPLFRTHKSTTQFINRTMNYLESVLAPQITRHGVLVDVYGVGILLMGDSGIGKSETALELVKRGHRLVADDAVEIRRVTDNRLIGEAPDLIKYFMEVRGIGIIDIRAMYGAGAIINTKSIDLVIALEIWDNNKVYDRLGLVEESMDILDVTLPKITIPVRPGRNLAIIVEVAAMNFRLKNSGYHAAQELNQRLENIIEQKQ